MNALELIEQHSLLTEKIIDQDVCEPMLESDLAPERAGKVHERAAHLRALMEACDFYAESIVLDTMQSLGLSESDGLHTKLAAAICVRRQTLTETYAALSALGRLTDRNTVPPPAPRTNGFSEALKKLEESPERLLASRRS